MEIADDPLPDTEVGVELARGRASVVYAVGPDRVLRRALRGGSFVAEATAMEHLRVAGYPVPAVHRVGPGELLLERVEGPTMLEALVRRPWQVDRHARLLADLHRRLHGMRPPPGIPAFAVPGGSVLHLDLHPANVIMAADGPVVIDWTNVRLGDPAADVAMSWLVMAASEMEGGSVERALAAVLRDRLVGRFLRGAGRTDARRVLREVAGVRLADPNLRPTEAVAVRRLVAAEAVG